MSRRSARATLENSIYASSKMTRAGSLRIAKRSSSEMMLPSGLLGEVRKTIFAPCFCTASVTPAFSSATCFLLPLTACMRVCKDLHPFLPELRNARSDGGHLPSTSSWKPFKRGTVTTCALLTLASKAYIVKVGGQSTIVSPGSKQHLMIKSMSSSAPHPTCRHISDPFEADVCSTPK